MKDAAIPITYQLKVHLIGISPMIWRRFLVSGDSTIADLHYILQIVMGWRDEHLNRFIINGKQFGVGHPGGISFSDDPSSVRLRDLDLREREKFRYEYDFLDHWHHQLRVEAIKYPDMPLATPVCIDGKRTAPPEDCGGIYSYLAKRQHYSYGHCMTILADILERGKEAVSEHYEEIQRLSQWLSLDQFDCDAVNKSLQQYADGERDWLFAEVIK